jgi:hypothetical protein
MYGRFRSKPSEEEEKAVKMARLNKMKKIYLPPRISPSMYCLCCGMYIMYTMETNYYQG